MEEMTLKDILVWIMEHSDDYEAMNKINRITYQFVKTRSQHEVV